MLTVHDPAPLSLKLSVQQSPSLPTSPRTPQGAGLAPGGLGDEHDLRINDWFFIAKCAVDNRPGCHYRYFTDLSASIMGWDVTYQKDDVTGTISCVRSR